MTDNGIPLIEEIVCPLEAMDIYRALGDAYFGFILDSAMDPSGFGRFSVMGVEPFGVFVSRRDRTDVDILGWKKTFRGNPFLILRELMEKYSCAPYKTGLPFTGGAVGYFSYDLKSFLEDLPERIKEPSDIPDCMIGLYDTVIVRDNLYKKTYIVSSGLPETGRRGDVRARARMARLKDIILSSAEEASAPRMPRFVSDDLMSNFSPEEYRDAVKKAKSYIRKGDIYQVNISQRFTATTEDDSLDVYSCLREISPAPFGAYLSFGEVKILSSSPERFLKVNDRMIETRPIKGTRPRGRNHAEDEAIRTELLNSSKDEAEHVMIVDLERNDLGRVCEYGTVHVPEYKTCEEFPNVYHLTSTVRGTLKEGVEPIDALMSSFPGGSITGAPKIRSMEIIEELETVKRSVYTGALGYIGFNGDMDTSIVIRTMVMKGSELSFNVGGGIVYDSVPSEEYKETLYKARGMLETLGYKIIGTGKR